MSDLTTKLQYLADTKTAIKEALVEKGVEVADTDTFRSYANKISSIESGGDLDGLIEGTITELESNVTSIKQYAFYYDSKLVSVNFPNATTAGKEVFYGCTNLESVNFPNLEITGRRFFYGCTKLTNVSLPNLTTDSESGYELFYGCTALTEVTLPKITRITGGMFEYCNALTKVNVTKELIESIGSSAFRGCSSITTADYPNATSIGNLSFDECTNLKTVNLPLADNKSTGSQRMFYHCTSLEELSLPSLTNMTTYFCNGNTSLRRVNLPVVREIMQMAFSGCTSLVIADFGLDSTTNYRVGAQAFQNCSNLQALILRRTTGIRTLPYTSTFTGSAIASGTGYIYVPRSLVATYQSATNWSTYASQFRALEDYTVDGTTTGEPDLAKMGITLS